jgi:hypothetical protein
VCLHGHPQTPENVYVRPGGKQAGVRECLLCKRARERR